MKKKKRIKFYKRIFFIIVIIIIVFVCFYNYNNYVKNSKEKKLLNSIISDSGVINYYAIYGIHLNIKGTITLDSEIDDISLVLNNGEDELELDWEVEEDSNTYTFVTSDYINEGINLETLSKGKYYLLIKTMLEEEVSYYSLVNNTEYSDLEYYTLTKNNSNNLISITWNKYNDLSLLKFTIEDTTLPDDVYDITIDPGHGNNDSGAISYLNGVMYKESEINLEISLYLKEYLEDLGYKVAITRETEEDEVTIYEYMGRAVMANDTKSKFSLAIHNNTLGYTDGSGTLSGLELYVANDSTFTLASILVDKITSIANTTTSTKKNYKSADGIYQRYFTEEEIAGDTVQPSKRTTNTIYYYFIREVGGISTNAVNDGSYEPKYSKNEHYDSNNTAEPMLFELGYIDNEENLKNLLNNSSKYAYAIATGIDEYLNSF